LNLSYEEALKALRSSSGAGILHIMDVKEEKNEALNKLMGLENILMDSIESGREDALSSANTVFDFIDHSMEWDKKNRMIELMVLVYRTAFNIGVEEDRSINYNGYIGEMAGLDGQSLKQWCINKIDHIIRKIRERRENNISRIVFLARTYIDSNYMKDISLEDVSREVSISPQYFSRLFKEQTGSNFIEYLTQVRINRSKELLKSTNKTVKEVCFEVGYKDPNYFSRLFKKTVGISPTEYLEVI
jgi:two-component system response regulator YesN